MTRNRASFSRRALALVDKVIAPHFPVMLLATAVIIVALGHPIRSAAESTINCPLGTYDMLDWMTLDSDLRATYHLEGTSNPLYTVMAPGKFYWIKGALGYPWDIQLYDSNYVYLWITELSWTVPQSYKKFTNNKICLWFRGARPLAVPAPQSKLRIPTTTCTQTAPRVAQ